MTALHERPGTDRRRSPRPAVFWWSLVGGVVVLVVVLAVTVGLLVREYHGNVFPGSRVVRGSGVASTQTRQLPSFAAVELAGSSNVSVQVGAPESVVVHGDD